MMEIVVYGTLVWWLKVGLKIGPHMDHDSKGQHIPHLDSLPLCLPSCHDPQHLPLQLRSQTHFYPMWTIPDWSSGSQIPLPIHHNLKVTRNDAKIAKIFNLRTFWPTDATLKMSLYFLHLWSIGQKGSLSDFEKMAYWLNYRPKCP